MYNIQYDPAQNRVDVKVIEINKDNVDNYIADYTNMLQRVKPGFVGMADLSEAQMFTQDVAEKIGPLGQLTVEKGMKKWANYASSAIKLQMERMYGEVADVFETREEAEDYLKM